MMEQLPGDIGPDRDALESNPIHEDHADPPKGSAGPAAFGAGVETGRGKADAPKRGRRRSPRSESSDTADTTSAHRSPRKRSTGASDGEGPDDARKNRSRRVKSARKVAADSAPDASGDSPAEAAPKKRRSRSRTPKGAREAEPEDAPSSAPAKKSRRGGRRKKAKGGDTPPVEPTEADRGDAKPEPGTDPEKRRRRRGSRGGRRRKKTRGAGIGVDVIPGEDDDLPELPADTELLESNAAPKKKRQRSSKKGAAPAAARKKTAKKAKRSGAPTAAAAKPARSTRATKPVQRDQTILVNAVDREEKRVAVVEDGRIIDLLMTAESQKTLVNDIYRGKVVNLEPAIGAAFIDFGQGRNGFLHTSDVLGVYGEPGFKLEALLTSKVDPDDWDEDSSQPAVSEGIDDDEDDGEDEPKSKGRQAKGKKRAKRSARHRVRQRLPITDLIRNGDPVVVQVTKDAIGDKGPTLTTYISIPGRYLVLMPSMARTGVSRKIPDDKERRRLKKVLSSLKAPTDMGVIVRTAGVGKTKTDLQRDLDYLLGVWETFGKRLRHGRGPVPLYQESDVAIRTMRDLFNERTGDVIVDDPLVYDELVEFATQLMPEHVDRIKLHDAERPIFHHYGIEQDFEKVFARRVELPSGGSIVFDQAEALVAIDVNSGRTRTDSFDFEEIALKTNLEAVPEMARQIRLRDLGGILVCDFIDMMRSSSNRAVERALRAELAPDRARSKLGRISQFGLLELTRQRLGPGTHKKVFTSCPRCRGTGRVRTIESRAQAILRRLGSALTQKGFSKVEIKAHPEVVDYLKEDLWDYVRALEHRFEKELVLLSRPDQVEDCVLRYLRADGREVRPGGRRKR